MFYIYTPQGRTFAGTMEKLRRVEKTSKSTYAGTQNDTLSEEENRPAVTDRFTVPERAISHYQQMLKQNAAKEAVYHAYQIMSQPVATIFSESTWEEAYALFERCSYQVIPVLNRHRILMATLSRRQLYSALVANGEIPKNSRAIESIPNMDKQVISADPVTDVRRIAKVLVDHRLDAVPVVEDSHRLVGIVSRTDVLNCVTADPPLSLWC